MTERPSVRPLVGLAVPSNSKPNTDCLPAFIQRNPITQEVLPGGYAPGLAAAREFTREVDEVDASLTYAMENGLEFAVWGRNLLNDRYISTVFDSPAQAGSVSAYVNAPRTYGVSARFRW